MKLIAAKMQNIDEIMAIIDSAIAYLASLGVDQWQGGDPSREIILNDINEQNSYILLQDEQIVGTAAVIFTGDASYDYIEDGAWQNSLPYAAIHRVAVNQDYRKKGITKVFFERLENFVKEFGFNNIRIDTHKENIPMNRALLGYGFTRTGIVYLSNGDARIAYQKIIL